jgi:hypothetical protein
MAFLTLMGSCTPRPDGGLGNPELVDTVPQQLECLLGYIHLFGVGEFLVLFVLDTLEIRPHDEVHSALQVEPQVHLLRQERLFRPVRNDPHFFDSGNDLHLVHHRVVYSVPADRKTSVRSDDEQAAGREVLFKIRDLFGRGVLLEYNAHLPFPHGGENEQYGKYKYRHYEHGLVYHASCHDSPR